MSFTIPKPLVPIFTKPMTPPWVLALVIVSQIAFSQIRSDSTPTCHLKFERLHYSTSVKRSLGIDAIKLNVKSICTAPQRYTQLTASMQVLRNGKPSNFYTSPLTISKSNNRYPNEAEFLDFWEPCEKGQFFIINAGAHGEVFLKNGQVVPISDYTGKFSTILCDFPAK